MGNATRRDFLERTVLGLAGLGTAGLVLGGNRQPTVAIVTGDEANRVLIQMGAVPKEATSPKGELKRVTPVSFGPWYKAGAPFRAKLSAPGEPGTTFVLSGRAWSFDTKRPLAGVVLDFWHVDMKGNIPTALPTSETEGGWFHLKADTTSWKAFAPSHTVQILRGRLTSGVVHIFMCWQSARVISHSLPKSTSRMTQRCQTLCTVQRTPLRRKSAPSTV